MPGGGQPSQTSVMPAFRWLRFRGAGSPARTRNAEQEPGAVARLAREGRRELLDEIAAFLLDQDLAVNPANLTVAWNAFSGSAPNLRRRIDDRLRLGEPVTQEWLDQVAARANEEHEREA